MQGEGTFLRRGIGLSNGTLWTTSSRVVLAGRLAAFALASALMLPSGAAHAQDATWLPNPTDTNFNNGANWSTGTVPTGTAFFGTSDITTLKLTSGNFQTLIDGWTFNTGASNYTLNNLGTSQQLFFTGAGIVINGGSLALETSNGGGIEFQNGSSAGNASITSVVSAVNFRGTSTAADATIFNQNTYLRFFDNASAGNASIAATDRTAVQFYGNSTADNATITVTGPTFVAGTSSVNFADNSTAGNSTIIGDSKSEVNFTGHASAGNSTITNNNVLSFGDNSEAETSTITNNSQLIFNDSSTAGSANIANNDRIMFNGHSLGGGARIANSGYIGFTGNSNGLSATITNGANAVVDLSGSTGFFGDGKLSVGSFIGGGNFYMGSNQVTFTNGNGTVSGVISDCGAGGTACANSGASGGALVKSGSGAMTLANTNTYTGGTTINGGQLVLGNATAAGRIIGSVTVNGGIFSLFNTDLSAITTIDNSGFTFFQNNTSAANTVITNDFRLTFQDNSTAGSSTLVNNGLLAFTNNGTAGNAAITNNLGGTVDFSASSGPNGDHKISAGSIAGAGDFYLGSKALTVGGNNQSTAVSGTISDCGAGGNLCSVPGASGGMLVKTGAGDLTLSGANAYTGGTRVAAGTLSLANDNALGTGAVMLDPNTTLHLAGVQIANTVNISGDPNIAVTGANWLNSIVGAGDINILGTSGNATTDVLTLNGPNAYAADTFVGDGTAGASATLKGSGANALSANSTTTVTANSVLDLNGFDQAIGALAGAGAVTNSGASAATLTANGNNSSTVFSGVIEDGNAVTALTKTGAGTLTLSGTSTFTGVTTVNGGRLMVDGSIVPSSGVQVNAGGLVGGSGFLPSTVIAGGGTLAPGTTSAALSVNGNLMFDSGAAYAVQVSPTAAGHTDITGTANLAGTAYVGFAPGNYTRGNYTILSAAGGLGGTTFDTLQTSMPGFVTSLGYTANDAVLTISSAALGVGQGLGRNQQNVANTINDYFNNGGMLPSNFSNIFGLSGSRLGDALSRVSGEAATGAQQGAFQLMNGFLGIMFDPAIAMGGAGHAGGGQALGFAATRDMSPDVARAYASIFKSEIKGPQSFEPRWNTWVSGFGGSSKTGGDIAAGSHDSTARIYGSAGGADYHFSPDTTVGFAFAGAGTNWGLADGLGGGKSDAFQAGLYGSRRLGNAYVSAAFAFANHWMSTDRYALAGDHLTGNFNAQSYGGRLESGYRFATQSGGITPYAAAQAMAFHSPSYNETDAAGGGLALSYGSRDATDTRSELGVRYDRTMLLDTNALLIFRGRFAWAHDWVSDPTLTAAFQSLPGSSFVVGGAVPAKDTLLASAGAELFMTSAWSVIAQFDTELSGNSQTYAGTGTLRYTW